MSPVLLLSSSRFSRHATDEAARRPIAIARDVQSPADGLLALLPCRPDGDRDALWRAPFDHGDPRRKAQCRCHRSACEECQREVSVHDLLQTGGWRQCRREWLAGTPRSRGEDAALGACGGPCRMREKHQKRVPTLQPPKPPPLVATPPQPNRPQPPSASEAAMTRTARRRERRFTMSLARRLVHGRCLPS